MGHRALLSAEPDLIRRLIGHLCPAYPNKKPNWMYRRRRIDACVMNECINIPHLTPRGSGKSYQFLLDPGIKNVGSEVSPKQINIRSPLEETCMDEETQVGQKISSNCGR